MTVENGRLNVALPFKHDVTLGDSLEQAKRRLRYLLNKLEIKPDLHKLYTEFISEFISMDHVETIPQDGIETSMGQISTSLIVAYSKKHHKHPNYELFSTVRQKHHPEHPSTTL